MAADALDALETWDDLTHKQLQDRDSAIRTVVRICHPDLPRRKRCDEAEFRRRAELTPMECEQLNRRLYSQPARVYGLEERRFGNVVSLLRDVLRRLSQHAPELPHATELMPAWRALHAALSSERRKGLIAFMGYCTREGIAPAAVTDSVLSAFEAWSATRTVHRDPHGRARRAASNWNWASQHIEGWPGVRLTRKGMRDEYTLPFEAYPASFQEDVDLFLRRLADIDEVEIFPDDVADDDDGEVRRDTPARPRTIATRGDQIRRAAAALVGQGVPVESLTSLRDLVEPSSRVKSILDFHRERTHRRRVEAGQSPEDPKRIRTQNIAGIGEVLRQVARHHCRVPKRDIERIKGLVRQAKPKGQVMMSDGNMKRLSALMEPRTYAALLHYPERLMRCAAEESVSSPVSAARLALYGVVLEIVTICPLRRDNIAALRLDEHLLRPRAGEPINHLHLPADMVKNVNAVHWPIPAESARLIETYLRRHRPHLAEAANQYLFPGLGLGGRSGTDIANGLTRHVQKDIGVAFNVQLMRHFAVLRYLRAHPGQYEVVRLVLGHKKLQTTITFYAGLEGAFAAKKFNELVFEERRATRLVASGVVHNSGRRRGGR